MTTDCWSDRQVSGPTTKLAIIEGYLDAFATACLKKAMSWQLVDGFASPGINEIRETGELVWGSPMLGVRTEPAFYRCLFNGCRTSRIPGAHGADGGLPRTRRRSIGGVNGDLPSAMYDLLDRRAPVLWPARPRRGRHGVGDGRGPLKVPRCRFKTEMLILFPTPTQASSGCCRSRANRNRGQRRSWTTSTETTDGVGSGERARRRRSLPTRPPRGGRGGQLLYFLIFATKNDRGREIMDHCMDARYQQPSLFRTERLKRLS